MKRLISRDSTIAQSNGMPGARRLLDIPLYLIPLYLIPLYLFLRCVRAILRAMAGWITAPRDEAFNREMSVCHFLGTFLGLWRKQRS